MIFKASLSKFQDTLQKALPAMPRKSTLPVLEHLSFTLEGNNLKIIATDQDIIILSNLEVEGLEDGKILVPGYKINEITKALGSKGDIEFSTNEETFEIVLQTSFGKYKMKGLDEEEYLDIPVLFSTDKPNIDESNPPTAKFTADEINRLAEKTGFAVSIDEFRPAMTGVLFEFKGDHVNAVATDSFRLVKAVNRSETNSYVEDISIIMPSRTIDLLKKIDEDVTMSTIETQGKTTHARFDYGTTVLISRIIDEQFPAYETVIPDDNDLSATIPQKELLAAIRRVSIFANTDSNQVKLSLQENVLQVLGEDEESGTQAQETIECEFPGEQFSIGFNYRYLEQALQNTEDEMGDTGMVLMSFSEPNRPALIMPKENTDELLMLIMPVRI